MVAAVLICTSEVGMPLDTEANSNGVAVTRATSVPPSGPNSTISLPVVDTTLDTIANATQHDAAITTPWTALRDAGPENHDGILLLTGTYKRRPMASVMTKDATGSTSHMGMISSSSLSVLSTPKWSAGPTRPDTVA